MKVQGQCHCGQIRYEAEIDPTKVSLCHCTDCQHLSGAPFRTSVPTAAGDFVLQGEPKHYIKIAQSGARRAQGFCPSCGTALYATAADDPKVYMLRIFSIKQSAELTPSRQVWRRSAQPWVCELTDIEAFEEGAPS
jgi:hypothetical protein